MVRINKLGITPNTTLELYERSQGKYAKQESAALSREIQMVPVILELATIKDKNRFTPTEITEITGMIKTYNSEIPATDLVKQLLNIGTEKDMPMSVQEIKDFLLATPSLDKNGQIRVIEFMKSLKKQEGFKYNADYIRRNNSFEKFMNEEVNEFPDIYEGKTEEELRKIYNERISKEIKYSQNATYTRQFDIDTPNVSNFINLNNLEFVYSIANCEKPEILAEIVLRTGIKPAVSHTPNELVRIYELSKRNNGLIQDLARCFLPEEITQITPKLAERKGNKDWSKYYQWTRPSDTYTLPNYSSDLLNLRRSILESLDLTGQINLCTLKKTQSIWATVDGDFERGKRQ